MNKKKLLGSIVAIVAVLGMMGGGTFATWTDSARTGNQVFATGGFDLVLGGSAVDGSENTGLYPGSTGQEGLTVTNDSDVPAKVVIDVRQLNGNTALADHVWVEVADGREAFLSQLIAAEDGTLYADLLPGGTYTMDFAWELQGDAPKNASATYRIDFEMTQTGTPTPAE